MTINVEDKPTPRVQGLITVSSSANNRMVINGGASAGSKHIIAASGATDAAAEAVKFDIPAGVYKLTAWNIVYGSHLFVVRLVFDVNDDVAAAEWLTSGFIDTRFVPPNDGRVFDTSQLAANPFSVTALAYPVAGATLASASGDFVLEAN